MSSTARTHAKRGRIQPYAWLGAGAMTLGLGAAMVGGTAVAAADTAADTSRSATADSSASSATADSSASSAVNPKRSAARANRGAANETAAAPRQARAVLAVAGEPAAEAAEAALPAAAVDVADSAIIKSPNISQRGLASRGHRVAADSEAPLADVGVDPAAVAAVESAAVESSAVASTAAADTAGSAAVVPAPAANPAPVMTSWLPTLPIVEGAHVQLALQQIASAQGIIQAQTWGAGNIFAGLAAIGPQVLLAGAAFSLTAWQATNPGAQAFLAAVAGIPVIAQIAQLNLISTMLWTGASDISLATANLLLPVVGLFGAPAAVALAQPVITSAREDGTVYAIVPLSVKLGTQPMASVSINSGSRAALLVDTGASGVVVLPDVVPNLNQLTSVGSGNSCFSGNLCYHYVTYETSVDFGGAAVADSAYVNVVTDNIDYPDSVEDFEDYFSWGAAGIVGVGANTAGPGPAPIATAALPGELSDGVLLWQNLLPFGLGGVMIFGPNALPTRVSVAGAPTSYVKVSVNGAAQTVAGSIIDSGGVYGTLPLANAPAGSVAGQNLPAGTKISVYAPDGTTLLYTFTTLSGLSGTPVIASGLMNTGNAPFQQNPVYMNYTAPDRIGSTDFSIW